MFFICMTFLLCYAGTVTAMVQTPKLILMYNSALYIYRLNFKLMCCLKFLLS